METFSALLAICAGNSLVTGEFPAQWPVTRNVDVFFDLRLNKRLSKQSWGWWLETPLRPLWCHCNGCRLNNIYNIWIPKVMIPRKTVLLLYTRKIVSIHGPALLQERIGCDINACVSFWSPDKYFSRSDLLCNGAAGHCPIQWTNGTSGPRYQQYVYGCP